MNYKWNLKEGEREAGQALEKLDVYEDKWPRAKVRWLQGASVTLKYIDRLLSTSVYYIQRRIDKALTTVESVDKVLTS